MTASEVGGGGEGHNMTEEKLGREGKEGRERESNKRKEKNHRCKRRIERKHKSAKEDRFL